VVPSTIPQHPSVRHFSCRHGRYRENGQFFLKITYKEGKMDGPYKYWSSSGQFFGEGTFNMDERCGKWIENGGTVTYDPCPSGLEDDNWS
jgi:hypothetical protein